MTEARRLVEATFREEHGRILAALIRRCRDFDEAEEALQEACAYALESWDAQCRPANPGAWLFRVATRRLVDRTRRRLLDREARSKMSRSDEGSVIVAGSHDLDSFEFGDDRLRLMFTCCHPALAEEARVALTLNALCGLSAAELGRAFLVRESTMAQRLVRAKRRIREAGIPYAIPAPRDLPERLSAVLAAVYLIYNEGHSASAGRDLLRADLCEESIRLARLVTDLVGGEPEAEGLLALLLLLDSRRAGRLAEDGCLVPLHQQDRSLWDRAKACEGARLLERALSQGRSGPYQVQAAIAALHADAPDYETTDWQQIVALYDILLEMTDSPVVALNRCAALGELEGADAALEAIDASGITTALADYPYLHATLAGLHEQAGHLRRARHSWKRAIETAGNAVERSFLERKLADLEAANTPPEDSL